MTGETNPHGYSSSYVYNAAGEETAYTDYAGQQTLYSYNEAGWRTGEQWLDSNSNVVYQASYSYDLAGQLTAAVDNNSNYTYSYDAVGNLTQQTVTYPGLSSAVLVTLTYGYDGLGHRTSLIDSLGGQLTYGYYGDQLSQLGLSLNGTATNMQLTFGYNNQGLLSSVYSQSGAYSLSLGYDAAQRVTSMAYGAFQFGYGYNTAGELTSYTGPDGSVNYNYDSTGQLTTVSGDQSASYSYDANGNRTMSGYQIGTGNQLLSDGTYTYTYNHNGQLVTKTDANGNTWTYSWDQRGRLVEVVEKDSNGNVISDVKLTYDIYNNLIGTSLNGTPQQWTVWDGKNPYLQFDGSGQLTERYITDPSTLDHFFAQFGANGAVEWLLTDKQGSVRAIVDDSGTVLDQITYDAYGNILAQTDAAQASAYLFQGGYYDSTLGLYRYGARWYDTHNGRWISEDPLGLLPDSDPYRFVSNSPTNFTDPSGLRNWTFPWESDAVWWTWEGGEFWNDISGGVGGGTTGGLIGGGAGAAGAAVVVVGIAVITVTPIGWAGWTVIGLGAAGGAIYGAVHGARIGSGEDSFGDGAYVSATDPETYVVPFLIGCAIGGRMYRVVPDGPYVSWPW